MDARFLDPAYRVQTQPFAVPTMPEPAPPALNDPTAFQVQPGPVGAQALAAQAPDMPATPEAAPAASPAQTMAQPAAASSPSQWTPERKAFADKANAAGRNYRRAVEARRAQRKQVGDYQKLKSQLEASAGNLADLKHMQDTYTDVYTPDSPATMAMQKQQIHHFEKVQRLRDQLTQKAQQLNKQFGLKLDKNGGLDENGLDAGDQQFDDFMKEGYMDALMAQPPD